MKKSFTVLKAASVVLCVMVMNTACQKQVETTDQKSASVFAATATAQDISYPVITISGKEIGTMSIAESEGYAQITLSVDPSFAGKSDGVTPLMVTESGAKYAFLTQFNIRKESLTDGSNYTTITSPLSDINGNKPDYKSFVSGSLGYSVLIPDPMTGQTMATSTIK